MNDRRIKVNSPSRFAQHEQIASARLLENALVTSSQRQQPTQNQVAHSVTDPYNNFLIADSQFPTPPNRLLLLFYLIPVIGFFPSLWTLYRRQGSKEQFALSRLSITLAGSWLLGYLLMGVGAETSEFLALRLLILNSFLTSGYFLVSLWLMFLLIQGKAVRLPGFSQWAERILSKHLP